jgi:hypothetical protein
LGFILYRVFAVADLLLLREAHNTPCERHIEKMASILATYLDPERKREKKKENELHPGTHPRFRDGAYFYI